MPAYVFLQKLTPRGLANIKSMPERIAKGKAEGEKAGERLIGIWLTMGEYDLVAIGEFPDDQAAAAFSLVRGLHGNVTTQTLKAFSEEEFAQIVAKLP